MHPDKFLGRASKSAPMMLDSERAEQMQRMNSVLCDKRRDAVDARKTSGIELVWMQCEEATLGIDDMNRHEFSDAKWAKPTSMVGPLTSSKQRVDDSRSNAYVMLTSRYVFGATAKVCEIILPIDDKAFSLKPMPNPDLIDQAQDDTPLVDHNQQPIMAPPPSAAASPQMPSPGGMPGQAAPTAAPTGPQQMTGGDVAQQQLDAATASADKAETRIYGWMTQSKYPAEARKVIGDSARIGVGCMKGPFPVARKSKSLSKDGDSIKLNMEMKLEPSLCWVDPWNLFPDDACGEDIHSGDHIWERDFLSSKKLRALKDEPGYLASAIDLVLAEGPGKVFAENDSPSNVEKNKRKRYEIWYYYGTLKRADMDLLNPEDSADLDDDQEEVYAIISMVNDTIIRAVINPLDSGRFPYDTFAWSRRPGHWAGKGVAEQMSMPQRQVNAATRALLNNAGISAGPQIVIDQLGIMPANGDWKITPNKFWYKTSDSSGSARDAMFAIDIPNVTDKMMKIIDYGMKLAEESTGIPLISQGQTGPSSPETFGAAELQDNNAHTWLRHIASGWDDQIGEPKVDSLYEWLLLDPEVPDDEKAEYEIDAQGSTAMVERAIQQNVILGLLKASENPAFKLNPEKLMATYLRGNRMDPGKIQYSQAEQQAMSQQPPAPPVQVQVAQVRNQGALQVAQAKSQADAQQQQADLAHESGQLQNGSSSPHIVAAQAKIAEAQIRARSEQVIEQSRAAAEQQYAATEASVARDAHQTAIQELQLKREIAILEYTSKQNITIQQAQDQLRNTALVEQTKRQVAAADLQARMTESQTGRDHEMDQHVSNQNHEINMKALDSTGPEA